MPRLIPPRAANRERKGFTLAESLVVLLILTIVGTAVFRVLNKQQQAYKDSSKQSAMQREIRLTSSFLPADLRSTSSSGGDVIAMDEDGVTFLANTGSSVICDRPGMGAEIHMPPLQTAGITLTNWYAQPVPGDSIFLYNDSLAVGAEDDAWTRRAISSIDWSTAYCPGPPYTDAVLDAGKARYRIIVAGGIPDSVKLGAVVRFARPVRYALGSTGSGKWYLRMREFVGGGWTEPEAIGGPFSRFLPGDGSPSGLQLRYFDTLGVRLFNVADRLRVSRIDVYLRTNAGLAAVTERRPNQLQDSVLMRVAVRNFK